MLSKCWVKALYERFLAYTIGELKTVHRRTIPRSRKDSSEHTCRSAATRSEAHLMKSNVKMLALFSSPLGVVLLKQGSDVAFPRCAALAGLPWSLACSSLVILSKCLPAARFLSSISLLVLKRWMPPQGSDLGAQNYSSEENSAVLIRCVVMYGLSGVGVTVNLLSHSTPRDWAMAYQPNGRELCSF